MAYDCRLLAYYVGSFYNNICMNWAECGSVCADSSLESHFVHCASLRIVIQIHCLPFLMHSEIDAIVYDYNCLGEKDSHWWRAWRHNEDYFIHVEFGMRNLLNWICFRAHWIFYFPFSQHQQQQLVIGGTGYSVVHPHINALPMVRIAPTLNVRVF